ncbi:MAG: ribonuclease H [Candidatus Gracilibacteria bacterium]|jgi:ribonuclease HI|nr:ribonuclease H [Candidatus Gracilibacteria bacterium]
MNENTLTIYTDGSCLGNPGPGGYGVIIIDNGKFIKLSGGEPDTTNNRMEMTAIIKALSYIDENGMGDREIEIFSDSDLLISTITKGWKKKANKDLWAEIEKLSAWKNIKWAWIKAHHIDKYNIMADRLANSSAQKIKKA